MSASTSKKIVAYRFDREPVQGFVHPQTWLGASGIEVLTPTGAVTVLPYDDVKVVCFVKDFEVDGWRQERRLFASRPKTEGLWVRALFRDNDFVEGILPNELLQTDPQGFLLAPPDAFSNNQRIFLPRRALKELRVMGVVGSLVRGGRGGRKPRAGEKGDQQIGLFDEGEG